MSERYERISKVDRVLFLEGSPVIVEASSLLKDTKTGELILQLKLKSIVNQVINCVALNITCFDSWGNTLVEDLEYQFIDLGVKRNDVFGMKDRIVLPNTNIREYKIVVKMVKFTFGELWRNEKEFEFLPEEKILSSKISSSNLYHFRRIHTDEMKIVPYSYKSIWVCSCGTINHDGEDVCSSCLQKYEDLISHLDETFLRNDSIYFEARENAKENTYESLMAASKKMESISDYKDAKDLAEKYKKTAIELNNNYLYSLALIEFNKKTIDSLAKAKKMFESISDWNDSIDKIAECDKQIRKLKNKKKRRIIIPIVLLIIIALLLGSYFFFIPFYKYKNAESNLAKGNFDSAIQTYDKLAEESFLNSKELSLEARYQKALFLMENGNYSEAIIEFGNIRTYSDSESMINESNYLKAKQFYLFGDFENSNPIFNSLGDYKDSMDLIHLHNYLEEIIKESTCLEQGTLLHSCQGCNHSYEESLDPLGHNYLENIVQELGCEKEGIIEYTCDRCGEKYQETTPATGHTMTEATCTKPATCSKCGKTEGKALGHNYVSGKCTRCGKTKESETTSKVTTQETTSKETAEETTSNLSIKDRLANGESISLSITCESKLDDLELDGALVSVYNDDYYGLRILVHGTSNRLYEIRGYLPNELGGDSNNLIFYYGPVDEPGYFYFDFGLKPDILDKILNGYFYVNLVYLHSNDSTLYKAHF